MDRLAALLRHFHLNARVFNTGPLCGAASYHGGEGGGYIHILKRGSLTLESADAGDIIIDRPSLMFFMEPGGHRLIPGEAGAETVCGTFTFGSAASNPLARAMAHPIVIPLEELDSLAGTLALLFEEAFNDRCGRQAALDRLCELLIIQLYRYLMESGDLDVGLLAGLADPRLSKALIAIHEQPSANWTLVTLAARAGMSRARFAVAFRDTLGQTPGAYLIQWRLCLAQALLKEGKPTDHVASTVGYSGSPALAKAFRQQLGLSPSQWLKQLPKTSS
ncbi:AraC family transcriptional regulator [Zobellella aerophila]|uniref:AraC family transcriptional regulator n=1 Tax=Zobellella aerophila TaxID=870480 RepID=A0ABP6VI28_9GAMM